MPRPIPLFFLHVILPSTCHMPTPILFSLTISLFLADVILTCSLPCQMPRPMSFFPPHIRYLGPCHFSFLMSDGSPTWIRIKDLVSDLFDLVVTNFRDWRFRSFWRFRFVLELERFILDIKLDIFCKDLREIQTH